eukprot:TRINITY_DN3051_c0_g1_i1.p1 TRINITY_DN3051_c0_g1~~TRINITY_DN3051_c0_g1_i1.p1  ORF type:complete len:152 (-),score=39.47 TRINITY_DN3051_c0_g1_i1:381-836(-)
MRALDDGQAKKIQTTLRLSFRIHTNKWDVNQEDIDDEGGSLEEEEENVSLSEAALLPGWEAVLWKGNLYISASAKQIREGSKEAFIRILEYAEETLGASHVIICIDRHTIGEKEELRSILRCFLFMGFQTLAAGHELLPPNPKWVCLASAI